MIYVGTSGFSYKEWKGDLYPEDLPQSQYLHYYSRVFKTTEINNTFYRTPSEKTTANWASQVPPEFRFALKLTQRITHRKRLVECDEEMEWFFRGAAPLWGHLACLLVQLPPWFKQDLDVLEDFLVKFAAKAPLAVEFRHLSWFEPATYDLLREHKAALGVVESDKLEAVREVTAPFVYMRLRRSQNTSEGLEDWARWMAAQTGDVFAYVKHAGAAPGLARDLLAALDGSTVNGQPSTDQPHLH